MPPCGETAPPVMVNARRNLTITVGRTSLECQLPPESELVHQHPFSALFCGIDEHSGH